MKPGKDLDIIIAEQVLGWEKRPADAYYNDTTDAGWRNPDDHVFYHKGNLPEFSNEIEAAWEIIKKLEKHPDFVHWQIRQDEGSINGNKKYCANICISIHSSYSWSETVPHAICLSALEALRIRK